MSERGEIHVTDANGIAAVDQFYLNTTEMLLFKLQRTRDMAQKLIAGIDGIDGYDDLDLSSGTSPGYKVYFRSWIYQDGNDESFITTDGATLISRTGGSFVPDGGTLIDVDLRLTHGASGWYCHSPLMIHPHYFSPSTYVMGGVILVHQALTDVNTPSGHVEEVYDGTWPIYVLDVT